MERADNALPVETMTMQAKQTPQTAEQALTPPRDNAANSADQNNSTWVKEVTHILAEQWFLIALGILIAIASQVQVPFQHQQLKRTVTSYLCISIIFFV